MEEEILKYLVPILVVAGVVWHVVDTIRMVLSVAPDTNDDNDDEE